jgi:hypothetical protein
LDLKKKDLNCPCWGSMTFVMEWIYTEE